MKSVGIDIGSSQVKVVEVQPSSKGFQVTRYEIKQLSRATGTDLDLEVIEYLRELATKYDPKQTRFCVGLRQDRVAIRNKIFPFADRLKIQKSLAFELEEDLPFSAENAVYDGKVIRQLGATAEVLACAAPKQHVSHLLGLMKDSSLQPYLLSTEGVAFANLFENFMDPVPVVPAPPPSLDEEGAEKPVRPVRVVLNIGHSRTLVCAFDGNLLIGVRSIPWGGRNIADAIAKKYNLPPLEASKEMELKAFILTSKQDASYEAKTFSDLISKGVRELIRDLQLTLLEFKSEFGGLITQVDMTGGVANIQGLGPFLTQHLEVPVNRLTLLDMFPHVLIEKTDQTQTRLGVALGLALEGLRRPRNPAINFMKGEFAKQSSFMTDLWDEFGGVIKLAAAASIGLFIWGLAREQVAAVLDESSRAALKAQARAVAKLPKSANEASVKKYITENRKKVKEMRTLQSLAGMNSAMEVLNKVNGALPDKNTLKLDVTSLSVQDDLVRMSGTVKGGADLVTTLQKSLLNVAADGKVNVESTEPGISQTKFRLSFNVDRNIQKVAQ